MMTTSPSERSTSNSSCKKKTKIKKKKFVSHNQHSKSKEVKLDIKDSQKDTPQRNLGVCKATSVESPTQTKNEAKTVSKRKKMKKNKSVNKPDRAVTDPSYIPEVGLKTNKEPGCITGIIDPSPEPRRKPKKAKKNVSLLTSKPTPNLDNGGNTSEFLQTEPPDSAPKANRKLKRKRKTAKIVVSGKSCGMVNDGVVKKISDEMSVHESNCVINKKKKSRKKRKRCRDSISTTNKNIDTSPKRDNIEDTPPKISKIEMKDDCNADESKKVRKKKSKGFEDPEDMTRNHVRDDAQGLKIKKQKKLKRKISATDDAQGLKIKKQKKLERKISATDDQQESDKASEKGAAETGELNLGQWQTAKLTTTAMQDKFIRLLGGAKEKVVQDCLANNNKGSVLSRLTGVWKPPQGRTLWGSLQHSRPKVFSTMALGENESEKLAASLENQYNKTLSFNLQKRKEGNAAKGLGFQEDPAKGKKNHIDIYKVKSVTLD